MNPSMNPFRCVMNPFHPSQIYSAKAILDSRAKQQPALITNLNRKQRTDPK